MFYSFVYLHVSIYLNQQYHKFPTVELVGHTCNSFFNLCFYFKPTWTFFSQVTNECQNFILTVIDLILNWYYISDYIWGICFL